MLKSSGFAMMSKEQQEAVTCGLGPVMISAGPGSGKTFVIIHRILYLIHKMGCAPQSIYVITFTKDAALSMSRRYQELLSGVEGQTADMNAVHFGTFHSFFYQIIRSHPKFKNHTLINASGKSGILFRILKKQGQVFPSGKDLQVLFSDISFYKNTGKLRDGRGEEFLSLIKAYDEAKEQEGLLDFDDMLTICRKLLWEDEAFRLVWQKQVGYLLVDEFQDTNMVQLQVMNLLIKTPYNVCVVGDDDQAIYGFRGSEPGIMGRFLKDYPEAEHIRLGTNYRCGGEIVQASSRLIGKNKYRIKKALQAKAKASRGKVMVRGYENHGQMLNDCVQSLLMEKEEDLQETAVLFRTNARMNLFLALLLKYKIPFQTREQIASVYEHFVVKDVMDYLKAAEGVRDRELFLRILNKPRTRIGRETLMGKEVNLDEVIAFYGEEGVRNYPAMNDAQRFKRGLENLRRLKLPLGIDFILHYFGYDTYLRNKAGGDKQLYEEWVGILQWLREDAGGFRDVSEWEKFQREYNGKTREIHRDNRKEKGVHVMTLHGCKGLEFKRVFIMYANEGNIPNLKRGEEMTPEHLEEERRLFYVGMTRAKEALEILYVHQTPENPKPPSRFIKEMQN